MIELAKGLVTLGEWRAATIREALTLQRRFDLLCPGVSEANVGFTRLSSACLRMVVSIRRPITLQSADVWPFNQTPHNLAISRCMSFQSDAP